MACASGCGTTVHRWAVKEAAAVRVMQQAVLQSLLPGFTLAAIGRWPATPLPAGILPKVRDRLAAMLGADLGLPLGLDEPPVRTAIADSVAAARLFWIDPEFTQLADHAAGSLPATTLTPVDLPAPHGMLAWAQPVGPRADLVAASWTTGPHGLRVVGYRSIGAGLPPTDCSSSANSSAGSAPACTPTCRPATRSTLAAPPPSSWRPGC